MNWIIDFSPNSLKFLQKNNLSEDFIIDKIKIALRKFKGEQLNIDIKKLSGKWEGFYRIRIGKLRIILEFQFRNYKVFVEEIDWRGGAYR
ncbi:type II toxin-antitoxin system RelE/ParE family toxin [Patescibacteria group bacterium]|nr:type II toxin-antitoxin system RelE/ParE family toxin [Patescibacteria group bacterium]